MSGNNKKNQFIRRIKNNQFQKLFLKNWLLVFLCIILPLLFCTFVIQYYSSKSLIWEMDTSLQRSVHNTNATLETLLEEVCDTLEKESIDINIVSFFCTKRADPVNYNYILQVNTILDRLAADVRENLYYSVDIYAENSNFLVSTLYKGQPYRWISDKSLVEIFETCLKENPQLTLFAMPRETYYLGQCRRVITIYRVISKTEGEKAFIAISVDTEKMISYIVDNEMLNQGAYLIVDGNSQVVLDTSGQMNDQMLLLPENDDKGSAIIENINGQMNRIFWINMEHFGWKCVQMISMEEYQQNRMCLQQVEILIVLFGMLVSVMLSYGTTVKLFRPIEAILQMLENPAEQKIDENNEIQYLLFKILELFQKNIILENKMVERLCALRRARVMALQEQMTPHFINNVLQTINWIAVEDTGDENSVTSQAIILLADMINTGKKQEFGLATVMEEIEYTRKFIELERLRYGGGILCHYDIGRAVENKWIPSISLQTLMENSIAHGFRTREGCGNIYVSIQENEQDGLRICVEDDGEGIEQEAIQRVFAMLEQDDIFIENHIGLLNLFQRFRLIYGEECYFDIRKSCYGGTCVEILTPRMGMEWISSPETRREYCGKQ